MTQIDNLRAKVRDAYEAKDPRRSALADWLYENHVLIVAGNAVRLAKKYDADADLCEAAALLHDIADIQMERTDDTHGETSLHIARKLMKASGFSEDDIKLVVDDAIRYHSCHGDERPSSKEGKILATADALAHFQTDFYVFAAWGIARGMTLAELKEWALEKIDRDLYGKIAFDDERTAARPDYDLIKNLFSR